MQSKDLNRQLRSYSSHHVKIQEEDYTWAKELVNKYVNDKIRNYITDNSDLPLRNLEYTGSQYERLKTETADEVDVMVVMDTKHMTLEEVKEVPGWAKIKVHKDDSPYKKYTDSGDYLLPENMRSSWLFSTVTKAINTIQKESPMLPVSFEVRMHGPAVQVDIIENGKKLSVDLVLSFQFENRIYVAKPYNIRKTKKHPPCKATILLRESFSLIEKAKLKNMDVEDNGCRHELLRIVKSIVRNDSALKGKLTTYHLKTAFLRYNEDKTKSWHRDKLSERFLEYIKVLVDALKSKELPHFFIPGVDLLETIDDVVILDNMAPRLQRIINSEKERNKVLKV